ncbi:Pyrimidine monooxygenase RutA [Actinomadura rubteroloni]|uniref:Pyrimidine monooxygenase RutA n=1 Tax=Actinomadura rubteroloni TaxID=1926885 RepID=A0A2P4UAW9_9ACTN|nr:TIGR03619 family F420-dependent LLM class oxidoreductase [Actinomadura rubteroloni]POM22189.1 Pyrimidine monooxygenase RutA [Actinomadura rubteroloni]
MKTGFAVPVTGAWATPDRQALVAREAEAAGYHSLWTLQRVANPVGAETPYRNVPDPLVTLAYLAAHTERVRLGVAILNLPFTAPPLLAHQAATLDRVAGGRLDLGLGTGWMPEEFAAAGVAQARRGARAEEYLTILRALWDDGTAEFHGEFYDFPAIRVEPAPVQRPLPVLLGGTADAALRRAGRRADGWISSSRADPATLARSIGVVRDAARDAGRDPDALRFVCRAAVRLRPGGAADRTPLTGSPAEIRGDLDRIAAQGMTEVFVDLNFDPEIIGPDADPDRALDTARTALAAFAP